MPKAAIGAQSMPRCMEGHCESYHGELSDFLPLEQQHSCLYTDSLGSSHHMAPGMILLASRMSWNLWTHQQAARTVEALANFWLSDWASCWIDRWEIESRHSEISVKEWHWAVGCWELPALFMLNSEILLSMLNWINVPPLVPYSLPNIWKPKWV